jgi:hypothetical protein
LVEIGHESPVCKGAAGQLARGRGVSQHERGPVRQGEAHEVARVHHPGRWRVLGMSSCGATGGYFMKRPIFFLTFFASMAALIVSTPTSAEDYGQAKVNPASLAEQDLAAESRGDVAAALALYSDKAIIQNGGLCWTPCVGKAAIQKELERRVAARNQFKIIGKYVSGNVAVVQTELQIGFIEQSGVDRVVVWNIYEVTGDKIAVATLVGQRTDPQTARFIEWLRSQQQ